MIEKIIRTFDIYGSPFSLRINGQNKFKSTTGGLLSIATLGVLLLSIIYFGKNFYQRENPKISIEEGLYQNTDIPPLTGDQYEEKIIVVSYEHNYDTINKPYTLRPVMDKNNNVIDYEPVFIPDCSLDYLVNKSVVHGKDDDLYNFFTYKCIRLNDYKIGGISLENTSPLIISMKKCSELDQSSLIKYNITNCDTSFNGTIDYMRLWVYYEKVGFSPSLKNPFTKKLFPTLQLLSHDKLSFLYMPLTLYHLKDDIGWIFNSVNISFTFNFMTNNLIQYPSTAKESSPQFSILIYVSDDYKVFSRTYEKIQDLLAVIGGFMKIVFALLNIFNLLIRAYLMDNYMVSRIFDQGQTVNVSHYKFLTGIQKNKNGTNEIKSGVTGKSVNNFNLDPHLQSRQDKSINSRLFISTDKRKLLKKPQDIDFFSYVKVLVCNAINGKFSLTTRSGKKLEQIRKKLIVADKVRDFNFIIMKMNEVENLKNIFLNDHQSLSMCYLQKPKLITSQKIPHRFSFLVNSDEINAKYLTEYFVKRMEIGQLEGNDQVLFKQLDQKLKIHILSQVSRK